MVTSGRWPVPISGSLVASTSPGTSVSAGYFGRKCLCTAIGSEVMKTGIAQVHWASARPRESISTVT